MDNSRNERVGMFMKAFTPEFDPIKADSLAGELGFSRNEIRNYADMVYRSLARMQYHCSLTRVPYFKDRAEQVRAHYDLEIW